MTASLARWWGPLALYMAAVFVASSRPRPPSLDTSPDLALHGAAYFVMTILAVRAIARGILEPGSVRALVVGAAIAITFGLSDEWHQSFVPERVGSWLDVLYDAMGAAAGAVALGLFWRLRRHREYH